MANINNSSKIDQNFGFIVAWSLTFLLLMQSFIKGDLNSLWYLFRIFIKNCCLDHSCFCNWTVFYRRLHYCFWLLSRCLFAWYNFELIKKDILDFSIYDGYVLRFSYYHDNKFRKNSTNDKWIIFSDHKYCCFEQNIRKIDCSMLNKYYSENYSVVI